MVIENYPTSLISEIRFDFTGYGLFRLYVLLALGANELGSLFGSVPGARAFHWVCL